MSKVTAIKVFNDYGEADMLVAKLQLGGGVACSCRGGVRGRSRRE